MLKEPKFSISQCGREITGQEFDLILKTVKMFPKLSQTDLAETICEHLGWYTASGRYKREACLKYAYPVVAQNAALVHLPHPPGCPHVPLYNPIWVGASTRTASFPVREHALEIGKGLRRGLPSDSVVHVRRPY